ncbi:MAG TPA: aminotransferase class I/II-fold pyridoxal phosphate-dependent enzyme, partial [Salinimicrobium sp.]|nr:aminotransferase class I/II-fold pyridoxal phosphate-dependent enzyme [Salinimicrobium sp.]
MESRQVYGTYRKLKNSQELVDFSSNDYLGIGQHKIVFAAAGELMDRHSKRKSGSGGSRLLSGNSVLYKKAEDIIGDFHQAESALIFNSGYDANVGFFSSVPQRDDLVFYDEYIHASVRDGISMGMARGYKFKHNDLTDLSDSINRKRAEYPAADIYVVTESVFSMDGDSPDLKSFAEYTSEQGIFLIIDEAHAVGVFGERGEGLVQQEGIEDLVFARIVTFGKAVGCHGAAILSKTDLREYLINFSRSLIYTTALPPHTL